MHSISVWNFAQSPNYVTNVDMIYPYSEVPYIGNYKLVKIPISSNNIIVSNNDMLDHIDYWGEGRIKTLEGGSGFPQCYNVNHQYQLVSNGPDRDRKIPNRIPVISYTNCDTSSYIKDNSVKLVTLMGAPINKSCAKDIARIIHSDIGKVVVYGFTSQTADIRNLEEELAKKNILFCHGYKLPDLLKTITLFEEHDHRDYLNITDLGLELSKNINEGNYENAVNISKTFENSGNGASVAEIVTKLLKKSVNNIMPFAFKLWNGDAENIVQNRFPGVFKLILDQEEVKITKTKTKYNLKIDTIVDTDKESLVFVNKKEESENARWKFVALWEENKVHFKILNTDTEMFLKLIEGEEDKKCKGGRSATELNSFWFLNPVKEDDDLVFYIVNQKYDQGLKLADDEDTNGNKLVFGAVGGYAEEFSWCVSTW